MGGSGWDELRALPAWHGAVARPSAFARSQQPFHLGTSCASRDSDDGLGVPEAELACNPGVQRLDGYQQHVLCLPLTITTSLTESVSGYVPLSHRQCCFLFLSLREEHGASLLLGRAATQAGLAGAGFRRGKALAGPTPLPWPAKMVGGQCRGGPSPLPFPSPALTFSLLGAKSLSKETTRNFTGKNKQGCRSERIHREEVPHGEADRNPPSALQ